MSVDPIDRNISIEETRHCSTCHDFTKQTCTQTWYGRKISNDEYRQRNIWVCSQCQRIYQEEIKIPRSPESEIHVKRLLKISDNYRLKGYSMDAESNQLYAHIEFYPFDPDRIRDIIQKVESNDYVSAKDLMELEKAEVRKQRDRESFLGRPLKNRRK